MDHPHTCPLPSKLPGLMYDVWCSKLEKMGNFTAKPLPNFLASKDNVSRKHLYQSSGLVNTLKRWSFSYGNWATLVSTHKTSCKSVLHCSLSLSCCIMCKIDGDSHAHLFFHGSRAKLFWDFILKEFDWLTAGPPPTYLGHLNLHPHQPSFKRAKKVLWLNFVQAFLWSTWLEWNSRISDKEQDFDASLASITFLSVIWCKLNWYHLFLTTV